MSQKTDHELVYDAQAGSRTSFVLLVERHYRFMFKAAWQWCGVREDAEDIAQEAAIKLANNIGTFHFESAFTTWLYRLVLNTAKDYYKTKNRKNMREQPISDDVEYLSPDISPEQRMENKDVLKAILALPEQLKETVLLVCGQGLSHREAGQVLECSEGTISWRVHEARKKIAETLEISRKEKRHG